MSKLLIAFFMLMVAIPVSAFAAISPPRGFDASGGSTPYEMILTWTNPADSDLDHINIYLASTGGYSSSNVLTTVVAGPNTKGTYTISNLSSGTDYFLYLAAVDSSGNKSAYTTELKRTTGTSPDKTSPAAVANQTAKDLATDGAIALSWTNPADDDFFQTRVYRGTASDFAPDSTSQIAAVFGVPSSAGSYNDSGLINGTIYYYKFRTEDNRGNLQTGLFYPSASATPSKAPVVVPSITSLSPSSGEVGKQITIQGAGFTATGNDIHFGAGGIKNVSSPDGTTISFVVPSGVGPCDFVTPPPACAAAEMQVSAGSYDVYVKNINGQSNTATFTVTAAPAISLVDITGNPILDGDTVKTSDNPDVYIIKLTGTKKFRRLILNPDVFNSYGQLSWSSVKTVSQDVMSSYSISTLVIEVNSDGSVANPQVFSLTSEPNTDAGLKHWLNMTAAQFEAKGYDWDAIYKMNHNEAGIYAQGSDITG